jgi:hypothetical protein
MAHNIRALLLAGAAALATCPALAGDVTSDRSSMPTRSRRTG